MTKKSLLLFIFLGCVLVSCKKHRFSDSYWVAVQSSPIPPGSGASVYDGMTLHFSNNKLTLGDVYEIKNKEVDIRIDDHNLFLNDTLWAEIHAEYQDSILLDIQEYARVKLIKLDKAHATTPKPELWEYRNWILSYNDYQRELFLTDFEYYDKPNSKLCIQKDLEENRFLSTFDKWSILRINNNQLFVKTFHQIDHEIYRIKKYIGDSLIELESLRYPTSKASLIKRHYISISEKQHIRDQIQNYNWKINRIIKLDTISQSSYIPNDSIFRLETLTRRRLSFTFLEDLTYTIFESDSVSTKGNWKISPSGNEIILNHGFYPNEYIDLITISDDSLIIGNLNNFRYPENHPEIFSEIEVYYKAILKKE